MTYVIAEPCIGTKDTACVDVCPVDCIHPRKDEPAFDSVDLLYIHPDECIDCGACEPACPVQAIFTEDDLPEQWKHFTQMNAEKSLSGLPTITARLDPLCEPVSH